MLCHAIRLSLRIDVHLQWLTIRSKRHIERLGSSITDWLVILLEADLDHISGLGI